MPEIDPLNSTEKCADPGGEARYYKLADALDNPSVPLGFNIEYRFEYSSDGAARITFSHPLLFKLADQNIEELGVYFNTGFEHLADAARAGRLAMAEDLIRLALDQFIEHGSPDVPIRSTLQLLQGEEPNEKVLVSAHVRAEFVLDMLEHDEEFYGEALDQPVVDELIVEEPVEEELIETTADLPLAHITYLLDPDDANLVEGIIVSPLTTPQDASDRLRQNATYTLSLFKRLLETNACK